MHDTYQVQTVQTLIWVTESTSKRVRSGLAVPALGVGQYVRWPRAQVRRGPKSRYVYVLPLYW